MVDLLWIADVKPEDNYYVEKQWLVQYFDRLYDARGRRLRRDDARESVQGDYVRLLLTLRWMMMDRASNSAQVTQVAKLYHGSTPSAQRWFKKFLRRLGDQGVVAYDLMTNMTRRANKIHL